MNEIDELLALIDEVKCDLFPDQQQRVENALKRFRKPAETFTKDNIQAAIEQFLDFGEKSFNVMPGGHFGYFAGCGWAARCLRYHLEQLKKETNGKTP